MSGGFQAIGVAVRLSVLAQKSQGPRGVCVGGCGSEWWRCWLFSAKCGCVACCPDCEHPRIGGVEDVS